MLNISPLPAISDNYIWILAYTGRSDVYVVDPGEAAPVQDYLKKNSNTIRAILVTHQHWDHVTGIAALVDEYHCPVFGPAIEQHPTVTNPVAEGDKINLWDSLPAEVMETPGHMPDHICWKISEGENLHLLCADTLFSAGCGRIFRGSHKELKHSLDRIAALPTQTRLYSAHEYTLNNLKFALAVEPESAVLLEEQGRVQALRREHKPSLPTTVEHELIINPFLRCGTQEIAMAVNKHAGRKLDDDLAVFTELRRWKDVY